MRFLLVAILTFGFSAFALAQEAVEDDIQDQQPVDAELTSAGLEFAARVRAVTSSATSTGRMAAVTEMLDDLEIEYRVAPFEIDEIAGH